MLNENLVKKFVNYNHRPFTRKTLREDAIMVWVFVGIGQYMIESDNYKAILFLPLLCLAYTITSVYMYNKPNRKIWHECFVYGLYATLLTVVMFSGSISFLTMAIGYVPYFIIFLCAIIIIIYQILNIVMLQNNIKKDMYAKTSAQPLLLVTLSTIGGIVGISFARATIHDMEQVAVRKFLFFGAFISAVLFSTGISVNFYKAYLAKKFIKDE